MKRTPGRPPIGDDDAPPARMHVTVASRDYDRAYERATRQGISVPELVRRGLRRALEDDDDE
jgi:hypothetical protein